VVYQVDVVIRLADEAEVDEMWSFVQRKKDPRWLWHATARDAMFRNYRVVFLSDATAPLPGQGEGEKRARTLVQNLWWHLPFLVKRAGTRLDIFSNVPIIG
jgi:hypothetical protein